VHHDHGEVANNRQPATIAVYNAIDAWTTELPITPGSVLRALEKAGEGEPRWEGKMVILDEDISVNTVGSGLQGTA
jgi:hypothetical protein